MAGETETANTEKEQREIRVEQRENLNIGNGDSLPSIGSLAVTKVP